MWRYLRYIVLISILSPLPIMALSYQEVPSCYVQCDSLNQELEFFYNHMYKSISMIIPINFVQEISKNSVYDYVMAIDMLEDHQISLSLRQVPLEGIGVEKNNPIYSKIFHIRDHKDLLCAANQWSDLVIEHIMGFQGALSYPLAFVELAADKYHIIMSDPTMSFRLELYSSYSPIMNLTWSSDGGFLAFSEVTEIGSFIKIIHLKTQKVHQILSDGNASSPCFSKNGRDLYYIVHRDGVSEIIQYNLLTHQKDVLFSSMDWIADLSPGSDQFHLILASNRSGNFDVYEFNCLNKKFKRLTYSADPCVKGFMSYANKSLFYSMITKNGTMLMKRSFEDHQTHYITVEGLSEGVVAPPHPHFIVFETKNVEDGKRFLVFKSLIHNKEIAIESPWDCYNPAWSPQSGLGYFL